MAAQNPDRTLVTRDLKKHFGGRTVVNGVDLAISSGEVVGLLGPNGAGKTTTFYMVVGLSRPDSGQRLPGRRGDHRAPDVPAGPARHQLPAAGAVGFPEADGAGEPAGGPGDHAARPGQAPGAGGGAVGRVPDRAHRRTAGVRALRRRTAQGRDRPGPGHRSGLHPPGRAVRGNRPDRGDRHPEHHHGVSRRRGSAC